MAFFLGKMNNKFVQFLRLNNPDYAEKFVIYRRKNVKLNLIKYSSHYDHFRREKTLINFAQKCLLFLCEIDSLPFAFKRDFFFLYADLSWKLSIYESLKL